MIRQQRLRGVRSLRLLWLERKAVGSESRNSALPTFAGLPLAITAGPCPAFRAPEPGSMVTEP